MRVIHSLNECSTLKKNKLPLTDSVWHGLLLEVHVLVVGVEPRRLVREKLRAQAEEEAVVGAVELRTELPGTGRETTEFVAGLKKTKVETRLSTGQFIQSGALQSVHLQYTLAFSHTMTRVGPRLSNADDILAKLSPCFLLSKIGRHFDLRTITFLMLSSI